VGEKDPRLYSGLLTADQAAAITFVAAHRLIGLAVAGYAPCIWIDASGPYFRGHEIKKWVRENLVRLQNPKPLEFKFSLVSPDKAEVDLVPNSISQIAHALKHFPLMEMMSAVYFLCKDDEVVYVGQSVNLPGRVKTHTEEKEFDRVYYLPVPLEALSKVELTLINYLRPKLNKTPMRELKENEHQLLQKYCGIGGQTCVNQ
jgi:hypothetical protein